MSSPGGDLSVPTAADRGSDLLDRVEAFVRRHVQISPAGAIAVSLWVVHTWAFRAAHATPFLWVTAPEKGSGKTRLLEILRLLVRSPWMIVRPSEAVLYRRVDQQQPTLLLDEVDTIFGGRNEREDIRAMLDAGHRPGATVPRCVGSGTAMTVQDFDVYCAKAIAGIGEDLPDTVRDRSIPIRMQRAVPGTLPRQVREYELREMAEPIRAELQAWAAEIEDALRIARPDLPAELGDRAADGWDPLLAIADAAGGEWPRRAREAARTLSTRTTYDDETPGVRALAACKAVFDATGADRLSTRELIKGLARDQEGEYADWWDRRGPARGSQRRLATLLKRYNIRSGSVRLPSGFTPKGYYRADFADAWARYVPGAATATAPHAAMTGSDAPDTEAGVADVADTGASGEAA